LATLSELLHERKNIEKQVTAMHDQTKVWSPIDPRVMILILYVRTLLRLSKLQSVRITKLEADRQKWRSRAETMGDLVVEYNTPKPRGLARLIGRIRGR
jgi:hypothetical protein